MNNPLHFFMQYPKSKPVPSEADKKLQFIGWVAVWAGSLLAAAGAGISLADALNEREQRGKLSTNQRSK